MNSRRTRHKKQSKFTLKNIQQWAKVKLYTIKRWLLGLSKTKKVVFSLIAILLITSTGASAWYFNRLTDMDSMFPDISWPGNSDDPDNTLDIDEAFRDAKIINVALLGFDQNEERGERRLEGYTGLPDTIMVAAINIETGKVNVISIPRDTFVPIYNQGGYKDKINSANYWGWRNGVPGISDPVEAGMKSQLETISIALGGVRIHYYVTVDMDAVVEIVDIMGGVYLDVPERTYHNFGRVIAEPGYQWFSGRRFLDYVRSREAAGGDRQRAIKQQGVMLSVFDQFKKANKLINTPQVMVSVRNNVQTNLSVEQIMSLALFGTQKVDTQAVDTHVLEGHYASGGIPGRRQTNTYYIINQQKRAQMVRDIWGINIIPGPTDVLLPPLVDEADPSSHPSDVIFDDEFDPGNGAGTEFEDVQEPGDDEIGEPGEDPGVGGGGEDPGPVEDEDEEEESDPEEDLDEDTETDD